MVLYQMHAPDSNDLILGGMMKRYLLPVLCILSGFFTVPAVSDDTSTPNIGASGLPIPRFVSLAVDEANLRTGPGRQYPILWVYKRRSLPLKGAGRKWSLAQGDRS